MPETVPTSASPVNLSARPLRVAGLPRIRGTSLVPHRTLMEITMLDLRPTQTGGMGSKDFAVLPLRFHGRVLRVWGV